MTFRVQWPDGSRTDCYSPSLVMHDHLRAGHSYSLPDFLDRTHTALGIASNRVQAKYGRPCVLAAAQLRDIDLLAAPFADVGGEVEVLSMQPGPPQSPGAIP